jgi:hypothetical protein
VFVSSEVYLDMLQDYAFAWFKERSNFHQNGEFHTLVATIGE